MVKPVHSKTQDRSYEAILGFVASLITEIRQRFLLVRDGRNTQKKSSCVKNNFHKSESTDPNIYSGKSKKIQAFEMYSKVLLKVKYFYCTIHNKADNHTLIYLESISSMLMFEQTLFSYVFLLETRCILFYFTIVNCRHLYCR